MSDLEKVDKSLNLVGRLSKYYSKKPVFKALLKLVPGGSSLDTLLSHRGQEIKEERTKAFFDELDKGNIELTEEIIDSEDFIHCFIITLKAAQESRQREKIRIFARLLKFSIKPECFSDINEFEETVKIIEELSYREILILRLLEDFEKNNPDHPIKQIPETPIKEDLTPLNIAIKYWDTFIKQVQIDFNIPEDEVPNILNRLTRSGLYGIISNMWKGKYRNQGYLTAIYYNLKNVIQDENGNFE